MKELPMFTYNVWMGCLQPDTMSIILSSYQHCDELQFKHSHMCTSHKFSSIIKLDLVIQSLLLDYILALEKIRVRLACILFLYRNQYF